MKNAAENKLPEEPASQPTPAQTAIITEALELLNEVKRYRGIFYKQRVAHLEAKARRLNNIA